MTPSTVERMPSQPAADWEPEMTAVIEVRRPAKPEVEYFAGQVMTPQAASEMAADAAAQGMGA